jgi:hypothetical protein
MTSVLQYLMKEFPDFEETSLQLLMNGISNLTEVRADNKNAKTFEDYIFINNESWHLYFSNREDYIRDILKIWPSVILFLVDEQLDMKSSLVDKLRTYEGSGFGIFLANTRMLSVIYPELISDWDICYNSFISSSARILYQLAGLSLEEARDGIRLVVNEVVLHAEKYHNSHELFKKLIKRQYQLSLTERNR